MSRSYRVAIRECLNRVIKANDKVTTSLEILDVLPCEEMTDILEKELEKKGYTKDEDGNMCKEEDGVKIAVDPKTGEVSVTTQDETSVDLLQEKEGRAYDDQGNSAKQVRNQLREQAKAELEKQACEKTEELQKEVTDRLEKRLNDVRTELDQAVNRTTSEALKIKASRLGEIKEVSEDEQAGNLTIVVEV